MRKILALMMALSMLCGPALAEEEDDVSLADILRNADQDAVSTTVIAPSDDMAATEDQVLEEPQAEEDIYEADGSVLITLTAIVSGGSTSLRMKK